MRRDIHVLATTVLQKDIRLSMVDLGQLDTCLRTNVPLQ